MNDSGLINFNNFSKNALDIIKKEYQVYLSDEKIEILNSINPDTFFTFNDSSNKNYIILGTKNIYLRDDLYQNLSKTNDPYILNFLKKYDNSYQIYQDLIIYLYLIFICDELTPLKLGLIEKEVRNLSIKYNFSISSINNYKELEVINILYEKILSDLPYKIIFLDSDIEIFNYLLEEKDINVAKLYYQISKEMINEYSNFPQQRDNLENILNFYKNINYENILDNIYSFIHKRVK